MKQTTLKSLVTLAVTIAASAATREVHATQTNDSCVYPNTCLIANNTYGGYPGMTAYTTNSYAIYGDDTGSGYGLYGNSNTGYGLYATSSYGDGVHAVISNSETAVYGWNQGGGAGGYFISDTGYGIIAQSSGTYAGLFNGGLETNNYYYQNDNCVAGCPSDQRLKKNIAPLTGAMDTLLRLRGVTYEWINPEEHGKNQTGAQPGLIAQEVEQVFPQWVGEDNKGFKTMIVQPAQIAALEVESIRQLKTQNDELRAQLEGNQARTAKLEERLDALQNGRDPITGGVGFGRGVLCVIGLGFAGIFGASRWKRSEPKA
jgi:hypothetical protein